MTTTTWNPIQETQGRLASYMELGSLLGGLTYNDIRRANKLLKFRKERDTRGRECIIVADAIDRMRSSYDCLPKTLRAAIDRHVGKPAATTPPAPASTATPKPKQITIDDQVEEYATRLEDAFNSNNRIRLGSIIREMITRR